MLKLNKKAMIFGSIVVVLLIGILLFIFLGNKNDDNNSISSNIDRTKLLSGYANDTKEIIKKGIYQPFEESDITYKIYGEIGYDDLAATTLEYIKMATACNDEELFHLSSGDTTKLGSNPINVKNHCVLWLSYSSDASSFIDQTYPYVMNAYVELSDGSLIAINTANNSQFQVNIYEKEIRIVLEKGGAYFRLVKPKDGMIYTVQVGDKVIQISDKSEVFAYSFILMGNNEYAENDLAFLKNLENTDEFSNYNKRTDFTFYVAGFQIINGDADIYTRGTNTKLIKENKIYQFVYYPNYSTDDEKLGGYLSVTNYKFNSIGAYQDEVTEARFNRNYFLFLENQKALNKLSYGFDNIVVKKANASEVLSKYLADFTNKAKQKLSDYNANKQEEESACSYSWFLSMEENCGCADGWYFISHVGCCPNGYTYSVSENKCVKTTIVSSCPSGTYYVGNNKCCKNGTTLSSNGLSCVASSGTKSTPSYYPNSNGGATKDSSSKVTTNNSNSNCKPQAQCEAKGNSACVTGMYEKDGKCCMDLVCVE